MNFQRIGRHISLFLSCLFYELGMAISSLRLIAFKVDLTKLALNIVNDDNAAFMKDLSLRNQFHCILVVISV